MKVVVNSTPLIALSFVDKLYLLKELFDEVIIPQSVYEEVAITGKGKVGSQEVKNANWLNILTPKNYLTTPLPSRFG